MNSLIKHLAKKILFQSYKIRVMYIHCRGHLPFLLNARGLVGDGVEVGVARGDFSEIILRSWKGNRLISVDPWKEYSRDVYMDNSNVQQSVQESYYQETMRKLSVFGSRSLVLRMTSEDASRQLENRSLDFVYIDAQHHYEAVKQDIASWAPKIRAGGLLAGHDYVDGLLGEGMFGVKSAVDEFVAQHKLKLFVTVDNYAPSWFIFLPAVRR